MKYLAAAAYALAAAVLLTVAVPTAAEEPYLTEGGNSARGYVRELGEGNCSGVVLRPGLVLTAAHCVPAPSLALQGREPTVISAGDGRLDYALLAFPEAAAPCPCARLAPREAQPDETVFIVGYPRGLHVQVVTTGGSQGVQDNPALPYGRRLVTTAPVAGGNSGGGVFVLREDGYELVGLLVESIGHLSFAVPLADLRPFVGRFINSEF